MVNCWPHLLQSIGLSSRIMKSHPLHFFKLFQALPMDVHGLSAVRARHFVLMPWPQDRRFLSANSAGHHSDAVFQFFCSSFPKAPFFGLPCIYRCKGTNPLSTGLYKDFSFLAPNFLHTPLFMKNFAIVQNGDANCKFHIYSVS